MKVDKIFLYLFLLWNFTAIIVFLLGFHNVDLNYNFKGFNDCNSFNCMSMDSRYSLGIDGMMAGFFMLIAEIVFFCVDSIQ